MFFKTLTAVLLAVASVNAHSIVLPALGVTGTAARSDVQRASTASPCGKVNIASTLATTTPIIANADGSFTTTVTDFNAGADGSRSIKTATVDTTAVGKTFTGKATVTTNGNAAPTTVGSDQVTVQLPAGTTCTGGSTGNQCLVSMVTTAGFGNCVVVQQGGAAAGTAAANGTAAATGATAATNGTTAATGATAATGKKAKGVGSGAVKAAAAAKAAKAKAAVAAKVAPKPAKRGLSRFFLKEMA